MTAVVLPQYALLRFSGTDAQQFLHAQLTCDVLALQSATSTWGGYCTPKGRLLATFLLWAGDAGYTMLLPAALAEAIRKRLSMYILRSRVKVEDLTAVDSCIGIFGPDATEQIAALGGSVPQRLHGVTTTHAVSVIRLPVDRYLLTVAQAQAGATGTADAGTWERLDIAAGIPVITLATQEEFVPQMVNLDLIGGLSYTKGCYPGQEIVARTHYLGRLKQRMYRAQLATAAAPGDKLYCAEFGDQASGRIVASAPAPGGSHEVLAVLQTAHAQSSPYHLGSLQGPQLTILPLPYAVSTA